MTHELIERLAREAGFTPSEFGMSPRLLGDLARFAAIVAEECAKIAEDRITQSLHAPPMFENCTVVTPPSTAHAAAIREAFKE